jgi:hypothetical protein
MIINGWNANPYIAREILWRIWGDFDVNITIDKNYMVAATGELQNALNNWYGLLNSCWIDKPPKITRHQQLPGILELIMCMILFGLQIQIMHSCNKKSTQ